MLWLGLQNCRNSETGFRAHPRHLSTFGVSLAVVIPSVLCEYGTTNCCFWNFTSNLDVSANKFSSARGSQIRSSKADSRTLSFSRQLVNVPCGATSAYMLQKWYHQFIFFLDIKNILNIWPSRWRSTAYAGTWVLGSLCLSWRSQKNMPGGTCLLYEGKPMAKSVCWPYFTKKNVILPC